MEIICRGALADKYSILLLPLLSATQVSVQLLCGQGHELISEESGSNSGVVRATSPPLESGHKREEEGKWSQAPPLPVRVKEKTLTAGGRLVPVINAHSSLLALYPGSPPCVHNN